MSPEAITAIVSAAAPLAWVLAAIVIVGVVRCLRPRPRVPPFLGENVDPDEWR